MLFNSQVFLYAFLPLTYAIFWTRRSRGSRYLWLTAASYVFHGWWDVRFCGLMLFSTLVSFLAGRAMLVWSDPFRRRVCLIAPIAVDLGLLGFFKYASFALETASVVAGQVGVPFQASLLAIVLPVG